MGAVCLSLHTTTSPRLHERLPFERVLHLCWEERRAGKRRINARGIDRSKFGILVEAEKPIPTGTVVSVGARRRPWKLV